MPVILTGVSSVTHLVYAASWLRAQLDAGVEIDLTIREPGSFFGQAQVSAQDIATYLPQDTRLRITHGEHAAYAEGSAASLTLLCVGAPGLKCFVQHTRRRRRLPRVVVVDEGIGSYGDVHTRLAAYRRAGGRGPWPIVRAAAVAGGQRLFTSESWTTYRRGEPTSGWEVNAAVAAEFARHLSEEHPAPRTAVFLTQPWPDLGVMSVRDYVLHVGEVRAACEAVGLDLVVHPHPADDATRYGEFEVRAQTGPVELDGFVKGAAVVIGSNSTALLNLAAFARTPAVRVTVPQTVALEDALSGAQRDLLDTFLSPAVAVTELGDALERAVGEPRSSAD